MLRLLLVLSLLIPAAPINTFAQKLPEDCQICGHACCCPEMCAPKIKALKEKAAAQDCSQPNSICSIQRAPEAEFSTLKAEDIRLLPRWASLGRVNPSNTSARETLSVLLVPIPYLIVLEIPTPPPKKIPA